ncbi:MAG: zinc-dependent peptidase, partial [Haliea sp.]
MLDGWRNWWGRVSGRHPPPESIPDALWQGTVAHYPFIAGRSASELQRLRMLAARFLAHKEFTGAHGLEVTDEMAVAIAAQACLPVLYLGLDWYDDFRGIVVHPGAMVAQREMTDAAGVVHRYREVLAGEAMERGPVTLSWQDVQEAGSSSANGYSVVIHEFVHKLDMRDGAANGCPPQPSRAARERWQGVMNTAYAAFREPLRYVRLRLAGSRRGRRDRLQRRLAHRGDQDVLGGLRSSGEAAGGE